MARHQRGASDAGLGEHAAWAVDLGIDTVFIDLEVDNFQGDSVIHPDPYALKEVALERFAAALVTAAPTPEAGSQRADRIHWQANQLHRLELEYKRICALCTVQDWALSLIHIWTLPTKA